MLDENNNSDKENEIKRFYPIGTPGKRWNDEERELWKSQTKLQRSYREEVLKKIDSFKTDLSEWFVVEQYGSLSHDRERYPLFAIKSKNWNSNKPSLLVTGGVHGYEKSGIQGALLFLSQEASDYVRKGLCNILVAPCVSPWGYEHIQRWNFDVQDPNRSFKMGSESDCQTEESKALIEYLDKQQRQQQWTCHIDLHETTDTDATEFMPAKHAEAGLSYEDEIIPDGFYLVGDSLNPQLDFQKAVIESVKRVTHIAPPDSDGKIIGEPIVSDGIIVIPAKQLGLCCSVTIPTTTNGDDKSSSPPPPLYVSTTEVYPDSPRGVTEDECNRAQVAAVTGAINYVLSQQEK